MTATTSARPVLLRNERAAVAVVLVVGLLVTAAATTAAVGSRRRDEQLRLDQRSEQTKGLVQERIASYVEVLRGLRGLFAGSREVSPEEFRTYVEVQDLARRFPGSTAVAFSRAVPAEAIAGYESRVRARGGAAEGFSVTPPRPAGVAVVVEYLEPATAGAPAPGVDIAGEPAGQAAVASAVDTGEVAATEPVAAAPGSGGAPSLLMLTALYDTGEVPATPAARRRHLAGCVSIVLVPVEMLGPLVPAGGDLDVAIDDVGPIADGGAESAAARPVYRSAAYADPAGGAVSRRDLHIESRRWRLTATSRPGLAPRAERLVPWLYGVTGAVVTLLSAGLVGSYGRSRRRAVDLAEGMTRELRDQATDLARLAAVLEARAADLERSNAELERFAYLTSHDLQEPLRAIGGFATRLADHAGDTLDEAGRRYLRFVSDGAHRMQALLEALLAYSRVGQAGLRPAPTDTRAVADRLVAELMGSRPDDPAAFVVGDLPTVAADPVLFSQLLQNLLANSLKFRGPDRPARVEISAARDGGAWEFAVDDNGIGIDPAYRGRIFEVFARLHTVTEYPGTGIGLSVCQRVVERHGGRIWAGDSPLGGTRISFTIPDAGPGAPAARP